MDGLVKTLKYRNMRYTAIKPTIFNFLITLVTEMSDTLLLGQSFSIYELNERSSLMFTTFLEHILVELILSRLSAPTDTVVVRSFQCLRVI